MQSAEIAPAQLPSRLAHLGGSSLADDLAKLVPLLEERLCGLEQDGARILRASLPHRLIPTRKRTTRSPSSGFAAPSSPGEEHGTHRSGVLGRVLDARQAVLHGCLSVCHRSTKIRPRISHRLPSARVTEWRSRCTLGVNCVTTAACKHRNRQLKVLQRQQAK